MSGLVDQLCFLLREQGATHMGCATDRVIESFRNDLYPGYKTSAGMPPELLAQFPIAEAASRRWASSVADGRVRGRRRHRRRGRPLRRDPRVEKILICTPDKDMAQLVVDDRIVLWDRRRDLTYDDAGVRAKWGVPPTSCRTAWPSWATPRTATPASPAGATRRPPRSSRYGHFEQIPEKGSEWDVSGVRDPVGLAATLRDRMAEALLYRDLARLRTTADGVQIPQQDVDELEWHGADRARWEAFCDEWGLDRLRSRPHRWLGEAAGQA